MAKKLNTRSYTSVATFSADLAHVLSSELGVEVASTAELQEQVSGRALDMTMEQRERRKLAKRIVKAVQPSLEQALRNESELSGRPFEKQMRELDMVLDNSVLSRRGSFSAMDDDEDETQHVLPSAEMVIEDEASHSQGKARVNGTALTGPVDSPAEDVEMLDIVDTTEEHGDDLNGPIAQLNGELLAETGQVIADNTPPPSTNGIKGDAPRDSSAVPLKAKPGAEPPTPPLSLGDQQQSILVSGGIPWYIEPFDPDGTTVREERWTGREVLREMSEELTDLDEDELAGLGADAIETEEADVTAATSSITPAAKDRNTKKNGKAKRRWRGYR